MVLTTNGREVLVDDDDLRLLSEFKWSAYRTAGDCWYARTTDSAGLYMHRLLMGAGEGVEVDHINGNGLDNRRSNLRLASHRLNLANQRPQVGRSSIYKGVSYATGRNSWETYIKVDGRRRHLGYFAEEVLAAHAYDSAAVEAWGEFCRPNFITCMSKVEA